MLELTYRTPAAVYLVFHSSWMEENLTCTKLSVHSPPLGVTELTLLVY